MSYDIYTGLLKVFPLPTESDAKADTFFEYNHPKFDELKSKYPINSVAGSGDELSKAINLLGWVSSHIFHKGDYMMGETPQNSLDLLEYAFDKGAENGINCACLAKILAECLLAVGLPAKQVFIMPCSPYDGDNHVVTQVYIKKLQKWIMLDPTYNAYLTDEQGNILSLLELRRCLANQERVSFNKEANYNGGKWADSDAEYTAEYFAKNLFYFTFFKINTFGDSESAGSNFPGNQLILAPKGFDVKHKALSNIEYRIKKYGDSEFMLKWLKETKKAECNYCSCADLEAAANN